MSQGGEREVLANLASCLADEGAPHHASGLVVGEGEVDSLLEELLTVFN